jgi:group I intron endonuclease
MANFCNNHKYNYIYKTVNLCNNKSYVGFHATNKEYDDYFGSGVTLKRAIEKYGSENFLTGIIEHINPVEWKEREKYWIKEMKSHVTLGGYNLTWGGDGTLGLKMSDSSKQKISNVAKNRTIDHINNIKKSRLVNRELTNTHISESLKGRKLMGNALTNARTTFLGKTHTKETKEKIGLIHKGKILSDDTKNKIRNANIGKIVTDQTRENLSIALKGKTRSAEAKINYRNSKLGKKRSSQICPYCQKIIANGNFQRWHGENCKHNITKI